MTFGSRSWHILGSLATIVDSIIQIQGTNEHLWSRHKLPLKSYGPNKHVHDVGHLHIVTLKIWHWAKVRTDNRSISNIVSKLKMSAKSFGLDTNFGEVSLHNTAPLEIRGFPEGLYYADYLHYNLDLGGDALGSMSLGVHSLLIGNNCAKHKFWLWMHWLFPGRNDVGQQSRSRHTSWSITTITISITPYRNYQLFIHIYLNHDCSRCGQLLGRKSPWPMALAMIL